MDESENRLIERTLNWIASQGYTVIFNVNGTFEELLKTMCRESNRLGRESAQMEGLAVTDKMVKEGIEVLEVWPEVVPADRAELWPALVRELFLSMYAKR